MKKLIIFSMFLITMLSCKQETLKKKRVKIYIKGDERVVVSKPFFIEVDTPTMFSNIEAKIKQKLSLKDEWKNGEYDFYDYKLNDEEGSLIVQDTPIEGETTVFARTNYTKFSIEKSTINGRLGDKPKGRIIIPKEITSVGYHDKKLDAHRAPFDSCINLTAVDVSLAKGLKYLNLRGTGIGSINLSNNSSLEYLNLGETNITSLDLSCVPHLLQLNLVVAGELANLDLSHNKELKYVNLTQTKITSVDLSNNLKLEELFLESTNVEEVDISLNKELKILSVPYTKIKSIDVSKNQKLESVGFYACSSLTEADLSKNLKLTKLQSYAFGLTTEVVVKLPSSIQTIGNDAFGNKAKFCKKVIVPNATIKNLVKKSGYPEDRIEIN